MILLQKVLPFDKIEVKSSFYIAYYRSTTWKSIHLIKNESKESKIFQVKANPDQNADQLICFAQFCCLFLFPPISLRGTSYISTLIKTHFMGYYYYSYGVAIHKTGIPSDWGHFLEGLTQQSHNPWLLFRLTVFPLDNLFFKKYLQGILTLWEGQAVYWPS